MIILLRDILRWWSHENYIGCDEMWRKLVEVLQSSSHKLKTMAANHVVTEIFPTYLEIGGIHTYHVCTCIQLISQDEQFSRTQFCMMGIKNISNLSSSKIPLTCRLSCFSDLHGAGWTTPVLRLPGPCDLSRWQAVKTIELNKTLQLCWRVEVFPGEKGIIDNYCTFFSVFSW